MKAAAAIRSKSRPASEPSDVEMAEICALNERSIGDLLDRREGVLGLSDTSCRRDALRWPFPGTVELWIPDERGVEHYFLATSTNLSRRGIGLRCDEPIVPGKCVRIAFHEPEMSLHGEAVVRHCTASDDGSFLLGLQFLFTTS